MIPQKPGKPNIVVIEIVYKLIGILILNVPYSRLKLYRIKKENKILLKILNKNFILSPVNYITDFYKY